MIHPQPELYRVLGSPIHAVGMSEALDLADAFIASGEPHTVFAMNPWKVMSSREDPALAACLEAADLLIPDGVGGVAAVRLKYGRRIEQVGGVDLMAEVLARAEERGYSAYFLGAAEEVSRAAVEAIRDRFPRLVIAGRRNGFFSEDEEAEVVAEINAAKPDMLFVAMGSPKQEFWISSHLEALHVPWIQGVGGSLDVWGGGVRRAPHWMYKLHMEWFHRLASDWKRLPRHTAAARFAGLAVLEAVAYRAL